MSSAWSQGTFCSRRVRLPVTESLTTMFWPLVSASSCSTERTSMSWKFRVRRSPVYSFFSSCGGVLERRLDLDGVLIVGLVGELLEIALRADHQARAALDPDRIDGLHRRREVHHVVAAHEVLRHQRAREIHHHLIAFLAHVDRRARIGELHDHAAGAVGAAAEIDGLDGALHRGGALAGAGRAAALAPAGAPAWRPRVTMMLLPSTLVV